MKKILILLVILFLMATVFLFVINYKNEKRLLESNMGKIRDSYTSLSNNVSEYNSIREELNNKLSSFFYDSFLKEKDGYEAILSNYNTVIKNIDLDISLLDKNCDVLYKDSDINKICRTYKSLYEKLINIYVNDLNNYNERITGYNEYKKDNIVFYEMIHSEYIDYNLDGEYAERK